jgi:ATP-binding cassette subfamily B protein/subfamily B ATP-binding cassette protein MsbA
MAAVLWGLNFTSIYPFLKLLHDDQSPQQWVDGQISIYAKEVEVQQKEVDRIHDNEEKLNLLPKTTDIDKQLRTLSSDHSKASEKLNAASLMKSRYEIARKYILKLPEDRFHTLLLVIAAVVVGVAVKCVFEFGQEYLVGSVVNLTLFDLRNRFYRNVIHLDVAQFSEAGSSELMARFTNDMESLGTGIKTLFGKVIAEPLRALACVLLACWISWQLTLFFLILVPVAVLVLTKVGRIMKQATRRQLERMSSIYKILQETFQGIRVVQSFTREPHERRRFHTATKDYYHKAMLVANLDAAASPIIEVLGVVAVAMALLAGSYLVLNKETKLFGLNMSTQPLEPESLLQLYLLLAAIADPVRKLSSVFTKIQSAQAAADRIFAYFDKQASVSRNHDGPRLQRQRPPAAVTAGVPFIEFRDVCFSYEPGRDILTNINLTVKEGETLAMVGTNGCGKSTLLGLLPRFYDPDHGSVLVNGVDLRLLHLRSLRGQLAIVTQDTILFDDTIHNNIAYGSPRATPEMVEAAAKRAFAHEIILGQPKGYQTRLGETINLSGGEKQRIALARAILRDPTILILDEFTSQVDVESQAKIQLALRDFCRGRTTLLITHQFNMLEMADRIVVLEAGRLCAIGTHLELLASCQAYQRLHEAHSPRRRSA